MVAREMLPPEIGRLQRLLWEKGARQTAAQYRTGNPENLFLELGDNPRQRAALDDTAPLVVCLGTRRSGKSSGWLRRLAYDAATIPGSHQLYINTTRKECMRIAWRGANPRDGLAALNERFHLGAIPRIGSLSLQFPNGSLIECISADDEHAMEKALGGAYHRVLIDESQKAPHLQKGIEEILMPAMMDFGGQIVLTGTADEFTASYFAEVSDPNQPLDEEAYSRWKGWSRHRLTVLDNPHFGDTPEERYERTIAKDLELTGRKETDPGVRRAWFAEWVKEDALFVYDVHKVPPENLYYGTCEWEPFAIPKPEGGEQALQFPDLSKQTAQLPLGSEGVPQEWQFGLGVDLGYSPDPFAMVCWAWSPTDPNLYELFSFKQEELIPDQQHLLIRHVMDSLGLAFIKGDAGGGGKLVMAGWQRGWEERYLLPIEPAEKHQKATFQEILNNDIRTRRVKFLQGSPLVAEMRVLSWLVGNNGKRIEYVARGDKGKKKFANDCCDAALYSHRESRHHRFKAIPQKPRYGTEKYWEAEADRIESQVMQDLEEEEYGWD